MSSGERNWNRCLAYSQWHRDLRQHIGTTASAQCTMIDIDWCEYCHRCNLPVALIETTHGPDPKDAKVTALLAGMAGIRAYSVAFEHDGEHDGHSLPEKFTIRQISPAGAYPLFTLRADQYASWLRDLRKDHHCLLF